MSESQSSDSTPKRSLSKLSVSSSCEEYEYPNMVILTLDLTIKNSYDRYPIRVLIGHSHETIQRKEIKEVIQGVSLRLLDEWYLEVSVLQFPGFKILPNLDKRVNSISKLSGVPRYVFNKRELTIINIDIEIIPMII